MQCGISRCVCLYIYVMWFRHVIGPGGPPGRDSENEYIARLTYYFLGERVHGSNDRHGRVCRPVYSVLARLRQGEKHLSLGKD